jgi:hypothetical protein
MKMPATFALMVQLLCGCQSTAGTPGEAAQSTAFQDPAVATAIAADLSTDASPFLAQGSVLSFKPDDKEPLAHALSQSLTGQGYVMMSDSVAKVEAIELEVWGAEVDGELLVRLSTPSHRFSKVYRSASASDLAKAGSAHTDAAVIPAGPLLVETVSAGAAS